MTKLVQFILVLVLAVPAMANKAMTYTYICAGTVVSANKPPTTTGAHRFTMEPEMFLEKHVYLKESKKNGDAEGHFEIRTHEGQIAMSVIFSSSKSGSVTSQAVALPGSAELSLSATLSSPNGKPQGTSSLSCELED